MYKCIFFGARAEMIGFCPLASGSKGNCLYLGTPSTKILIDAGLSAKAIRERLEQIQVQIEQIDAILITHEHTDHIRGLDVLLSKYAIPLLTNSDTARAICALIGMTPKFKIFTTAEPFEFGDIEIYPFSVQHDAVDPVGFTLKVGEVKLGICADLGFATSLVVSALKGCDYLYLESNHQPSMVHACTRSMLYKQRVLGRQGHLSNDECAELLGKIYHPHLKHVHLAHLSSECNAPDLALKIAREKLASLNASTEVSIAAQDVVSKPVFLDRNNQSIESHAAMAVNRQII